MELVRHKGKEINAVCRYLHNITKNSITSFTFGPVVEPAI